MVVESSPHPASQTSPLDVALRQREAGQIELAIETLFAAAATSLGDAELALALAKMLAETAQYERAEPWFRHALKLSPRDLFVRMGHGTFLGQVGRHQQARDTLAEVLDELLESLDIAEMTEDRDTLAALENLIGATSVNLSRSALENGEPALARELTAPWLAHPDHWTYAHDVLADVIEREGLDPHEIAETGLTTGRISPYMVCFLIERALDVVPPDLATIDRIIGRANTIFAPARPAFDWQHAAPELESALATARKRYGHGVMRGQWRPDELPHLAATSLPCDAGDVEGNAPALPFRRSMDRR
jgi:tetratricopeptide (TPR) repeat protein